MSVFETLNAVNVNEHVKEKNKLPYLPWAWAWTEVKKAYPDAQYKIYETPNGCIYWTDGQTCWVKTGVTINGLEHIEYLPIMDSRNASIPVTKIKSTDVNTAIQRSLTKACARHGLGLYIYANEGLPEEPTPESENPAPEPEEPKKDNALVCTECGREITKVQRGKTTWTKEQIIKQAYNKFKRPVCYDCAVKLSANG